MLEHGAVKLIGTGPRDDRDLCARTAPELGGVRGGLYSEFLQRIHRDQAVRAALRAEARSGARAGRTKTGRRLDGHVRAHAVDGEVVRVGALTVDAELTGSGRACRGENNTGRDRD